jgi:hypothetical protein
VICRSPFDRSMPMCTTVWMASAIASRSLRDVQLLLAGLCGGELRGFGSGLVDSFQPFLDLRRPLPFVSHDLCHAIGRDLRASRCLLNIVFTDPSTGTRRHLSVQQR